MIIDFNSIPEQRFEHFKGGEGEFIARMFTDENGKVMRARLTPGSSIGMHTHENNYEVVYILSGTGKMICNGVDEPLSAGACHYCPPGCAHSLVNLGDGDLEIYCVVPEK